MFGRLSELQRNPRGILRSGGMVMIVMVFWLVPWKPQFVIPSSQRNRRKNKLEQVIIRTVIVGCILYPLDIRIPRGVSQQESHEQYVQVLLDISLSMAATDVEPSRFQVAKNVLSEVLQGLTGDSVSIITFSGLPVMMMPFSPHKMGVLQRIKTLSLSEFPPTNLFVGTALGDALLMAIDNLQQAAAQQDRPGAILLITDGDSSRGLDPYALIDLVEGVGVPVFALAIGSNDEIVGKDIEGNVVMAPLNPDLLRQFAERTGGYFTHMKPGADIRAFIQHVQTALQKNISYPRTIHYFSCNKWIEWMILCAVIAQLSIGIYIYTKRRK